MHDEALSTGAVLPTIQESCLDSDRYHLRMPHSAVNSARYYLTPVQKTNFCDCRHLHTVHSQSAVMHSKAFSSGTILPTVQECGLDSDWYNLQTKHNSLVSIAQHVLYAHCWHVRCTFVSGKKPLCSLWLPQVAVVPSYSITVYYIISYYIKLDYIVS